MRRDKLRNQLARLRAAGEGAPLSREQAAEKLACKLERIEELEAEPAFWREVHERLLASERAFLPLVYAGLRAKAMNGDASASKLYLTQLGVLNDEPLSTTAPDGGLASLRAALLTIAREQPDLRERLLAHLTDA